MFKNSRGSANRPATSGLMVLTDSMRLAAAEHC
jgi:hypothetical protein